MSTDTWDEMTTQLQAALSDGLNVSGVTEDGDPDPRALVTALAGMNRPNGAFTPVLPLSAEQAGALAGAGVSLFDLVDSASSLIAIAADHVHPTAQTAETLLSKLDELVERSRS